MKRIIKLSVIILIYVLLCGKSCDDDSENTFNQEMEVEIEKENIREEFEVDWLSEGSQYAAEISAIQKLKDFADYLNIYADHSLDPIFRNRAGEMIRDMFTSDNVSLSFVPLDPESHELLTLKDLLDQVNFADVFLMELSFDSIWLLDPLQKTNPNLYEGRIGCFQKTLVISPNDTISRIEAITIDVIVSRKEKIFGRDTLNVWGVHLGDMKINEEIF